MTSTNRIFLLTKDLTYYTYVAAIDYSSGASSFTPIYYNRFGSSGTPIKGSFTLATSALDFFYMAGSISN